jgi:hypothetical protein
VRDMRLLWHRVLCFFGLHKWTLEPDVYLGGEHGSMRVCDRLGCYESKWRPS